MKKNQVNEILINSAKRKKRLLLYVLLILLFAFFSVIFFFKYFNLNKNYYVNYVENSKIDYQVFLKKNDFFNENYLTKNNRYIASLIDYINTSFEYKLSLDDPDIQYNYSYTIEAEVDVVEKGTFESLYSFKEELTNKSVTNTTSNLTINENLKINYNYYNNKIKKFINMFELDDIKSTLKISMYVNVEGNCDNTEEHYSDDSVATLIIPLTEKTMVIDIDYDLTTLDENIMVCKKSTTEVFIYLIFSIIFVILTMITTYILFKYIIDTRTAATIYEKELKKILNNYSSYIQKANNEFDYSIYQIVKIDSFTDMLEIRDTIRCPILMIETEKKDSTHFLIPHSNILYMYNLKISEIKKEMIKKMEEKR